MKNLTDIRTHIKSVGQTRQITGAMETVSVAKMRKAQTRYENNRAYFDVLTHTVADIVAHSRDVDNPYIKPRAGEKAAYVVVASDKGLAGGFNHNLLEYALERIGTAKDATVFTVGYMAREFFVQRGKTVDETFLTAAYDPTVRDAKKIGAAIRKQYDIKAFDKAFILYTHAFSSSGMQPQCLQLLPLSQLFSDAGTGDTVDAAQKEVEFEPSAEEVLTMLVPQVLTGLIYGALVQSAACEHRARRDAMHSATTNADRVLEELDIEYHRARQEAVTGELSEIITAAMGVSDEK